MSNGNGAYSMGYADEPVAPVQSANGRTRGDQYYDQQQQGGVVNDVELAQPGQQQPQPVQQPGLNRFREAAQGNYESAQQKAIERAAQEKEAALQAKGEAEQLARESYQQAQQTQQLGQDMRNEMNADGGDGSGGGGLPAAALQQTATNNLQRVEGQFAANKTMLQKNREAVNQAQGDAKVRMEEAAGMGRQALETAAAATVDMARGEFEGRCARLAEEEGRLNLIAAEIQKREKQLDLLRNRGVPNWPCNCCCFSYMVHHDIRGDIDLPRQGFMKRTYFNWFATIFLLLANCGVAVTVMVIEPDDDKRGATAKERETEFTQHMAVSIALLMGCFFSFVIWYWPIYKAVGSGSSSQYTLAKVGLWVGIFFNVFAAIGVTGFGGCGFLYAIAVRNSKNENASIAAFVLGILWAIQGITFLFTFLTVRKYMKEDAASMLKAKGEMLVSHVANSVGL